VQAEIEIVLHVGRVEHRDAAGFENVLALVRERRGFCRMIVTGKHEDAAVLRGACGVRVFEDVAAAVHAGSLAVPHAVDAVVLRPGNMPICCEPQIAVAARSSFTPGWNFTWCDSRCFCARHSAWSRPPSGEPR
jgi:hypothetical protein